MLCQNIQFETFTIGVMLNKIIIQFVYFIVYVMYNA